MAVQFADKALDAWLTDKIQQTNKELEGISSTVSAISYLHYYLKALQDTQKQLHEFWGASMAPKNQET